MSFHMLVNLFLDTTGPRLSFPSNLPKHTLSSPWFNWTSDETADRFLCSLDGQFNWEICGSGKKGVWQKYNVPDGKHELFVQGTDDLGNTGPKISHTFTVGKLRVQCWRIFSSTAARKF